MDGVLRVLRARWAWARPRRLILSCAGMHTPRGPLRPTPPPHRGSARSCRASVADSRGCPGLRVARQVSARVAERPPVVSTYGAHARIRVIQHQANVGAPLLAEALLLGMASSLYARLPLSRGLGRERWSSRIRGLGSRERIAIPRLVHLRAPSPRRRTIECCTSSFHQEASALFDWLEGNGVDCSKVDVQNTIPMGDTAADDGTVGKPIHTLRAACDIAAGELVFKVPLSSFVTLERVFKDETLAQVLTTSPLSELSCLTLYLMYEKKQELYSNWYAFIKELDRQRARGQQAVVSPLLWQEEDIEQLLHGSPIKKLVQDRLNGLRKEYEALDTVWFMAGSLFDEYPYEQPTEAFSFEIFKQAFVAVQSCVVHFNKAPLARRFALVPLGPPLLTYSSTSKAMLQLSEDGDAVEYVADRAYVAGDILTVWCGPQPNSRLLLNYGIINDFNPYDRLTVRCELDAKDPQYAEKRQLLLSDERSSVQEFQLYRDKDPVMSDDFVPFLRLAVANQEELSAANGDFTEAISSSNEAAALHHLQDALERQLAGYKTTMAQDDDLIENAIDLRVKVATRLLRIEKAVLSRAILKIKEIYAGQPELEAFDVSSATHLPVLTFAA